MLPIEWWWLPPQRYIWRYCNVTNRVVVVATSEVYMELLTCCDGRSRVGGRIHGRGIMQVLNTIRRQSTSPSVVPCTPKTADVNMQKKKKDGPNEISTLLVARLSTPRVLISAINFRISLSDHCAACTARASAGSSPLACSCWCCWCSAAALESAAVSVAAGLLSASGE
jgi:hypothetical protein